MTHSKHPGGRPAIWGDREAMTIRVPEVVKAVLEASAQKTSDKLAVYCVRVLSADHGVQLDPDAHQLVLGAGHFEGLSLDTADALKPATWDNRQPMNIRPPIALRAVLTDSARRMGIKPAEYCVIRLAARHGYELSPSIQRDQLPIAISA